MSKKTLYVSDLDGTLLRSDQTLSNYTVDILNSLVERGLIFSYATARSYYTSSIVTAGLDAKIPVIVYNGTFILENGTRKQLLSHSFSAKEAEEITKIMTDGGVYPIVYSQLDGAEKYFYCPTLISRQTEDFLKTRRGDGRENEVESADLICQGDVFHFSCVDSGEKLLSVYEKLKYRFPSVYYKEIYSGEWWLEVHPIGVSKANAVAELKRLMGCDKVVCFGDGKNDISMFLAADECYAVENADPELKKIATAVIEGNNDDGVAKWLEQMAAKMGF